MTTETNTPQTVPSSGSGRTPATRQAAPGLARTSISGRVLVAAGSQEQYKYPELIKTEASSLDTTGLVVCGADAVATMRRIRASHPDLFLVFDPPENDRFTATADDPFPQEGEPEDSLFSLPRATLVERIQSQIDAGASVAMTPTGHIQAGDRSALRAAITETNKLKRDDFVVVLPLAPKWLVGPALKTVMAAVKRSTHPVAITLCDSNSDPMSHKGVLDGAHELAAMENPPMFHKTDLAGLDAMAHGALAASVGVIASKRRGGVPGRPPFASRTKRGANVLIDDLLRFRRSLDMQDQWYASRAAPDCDCQVCDSQPIDRFTGEDYDCVIAAQHNAIMVISYINEASAAGGFPLYWPDKVRDAIVAHAALSQYVGTKIDPPRELMAWNKGYAADAGH